jgi:signal transduction histidine kinase
MLHGAIIVAALLIHLATHYATFVPALRPILGGLPYFRLHVLHEAEFLLIIVYAGVVFGLKGGLVGILITALTSIPFIYHPLFFGRQPDPNETRDLVIQVGAILVMGLLMVALYETEAKRRQAEGQARVLREADTMKTNFLSIASHELRTPLTSLVGFSELLMTLDPPEEERHEWVRWINQESYRLSGIVTELLDVSRIQSGRLALRREPVRLADLVPQAVQSIGLSTAKHRIEIDIPDALPPVMGDHDKLLQVLINLVSNAVKYSPDGGRVAITARAADSEDGGVSVSVSDEGIGISDDDLAQIFTTFHRVRRPETETIPGVGLGLYIVKSLVELMDGRIAVQSKLGRGAAFTITMPAWDPVLAAAPRQPQETAAAPAAPAAV